MSPFQRADSGSSLSVPCDNNNSSTEQRHTFLLIFFLSFSLNLSQSPNFSTAPLHIHSRVGGAHSGWISSSRYFCMLALLSVWTYLKGAEHHGRTGCSDSPIVSGPAVSDLNFFVSIISIIIIMFRDRSIIILALGHFCVSFSVSDSESVPHGSDQHQHQQRPTGRQARVFYPVPCWKHPAE